MPSTKALVYTQFGFLWTYEENHVNTPQGSELRTGVCTTPLSLTTIPDLPQDNIFGGVCFPAGLQPSQPPPNVFAYYSQHYSAAVELCQVYL